MPWGERGENGQKSAQRVRAPGGGEEGSQCRRYRNPGKVRGLLGGGKVRGHGTAASLGKYWKIKGGIQGWGLMGHR